MDRVPTRRKLALSQQRPQPVNKKNQNDNDDDNQPNDLKFVIWIQWLDSELFCGEQSFRVRELRTIRMRAAIAILQKL
jgi:hypothetical protein